MISNFIIFIFVRNYCERGRRRCHCESRHSRSHPFVRRERTGSLALDLSRAIQWNFTYNDADPDEFLSCILKKNWGSKKKKLAQKKISVKKIQKYPKSYIYQMYILYKIIKSEARILNRIEIN